MWSVLIIVEMNKKLEFIGIIPARYASTRFPGKPLAMLSGQMMIERVWRQAKKAIDRVWVATDDSRIYDAVKAFGGDVVMTSSEHRSGTDRCQEAFEKIGGGEDVIINIQGDEPFIQPSQLQAIKACFDDADAKIATLVRRFDATRGYDALADANTPKVVVDNHMNALYFSRSVIPFVRSAEKELWAERHQYFTHVGMYAYRSEVLAQITQLPQSSLELAESLEQLRWLQNGYRLQVGVTDCETIGIDTPADLAKAVELIEHGCIE